ncbi:hypothetical protein C8A01DRAFT_31524 [Parachaetomium inaequale]|uniref:Uncharacterized protein n=1 Tax=Parachaetomium inaequale TaxID=2588326 RepID=A0AAN6SW15_9PEZI|nr:hypothetical protein C8A01DRAFT_31524 [Parachaetomium inaequale]
MAVEGATQALVAAFFFGIVLNAASAALVLYLRGYGLAAAFRDSQRLVLVLFLLSAALWAQIDFIAVLLDTSTSMPCQIGIIFSTVFDQFARFSVEQFLLWALNDNNGGELSVTQLIPQVLVLARFLAGAVFIGFTRPQTDTFCVATTSALPVGILVTALDGVIILLLVIRAYSVGGVAKENRDGKGVDADRARALMAVLLGLVIWTGTSVPMLLGFRSLALATRTALPAGGLLVVIAFVAGGAGTLLTSRSTGSRPPEAPSPRRINISRDISTSDTDYPPTRFEDLKEAALRSSRTFVNPREAPRVKDETSIGFAFGMEGEPMPPLPTAAPMSDLARNLDRSASHKSNLFDFAKGKIAISHPIPQQNAGQNPWNKIAVMDLKEAAVADRERRARMHEEESAAVGRSVGPLMNMAPEEALKRGISLKRKEVASVSIRESVFPGAFQPEDVAVATTTSAQLSPGGEETRRRSPRPSLQEEPVQPRRASSESIKTESQSPQNRPLPTQKPLLTANIRPSRMLPPSPATPPPEPTKTPLQRRPTIGLPSNPRARGLKVAEEPGSQHRTILFVNNIEYNDPLMVEAIIKTAGNPSTKPAPVETPGTSRSVVNRPRPIPRKAADSPAQSSPALSHRRTKSGGSVMGRKSLLASSPGSPTQLPPLPTLPRSATMPARPYPNNTKSMTFEEKVTLLFPSPPSGKAIKRRSSVPDVPRIPASYMDMDSSPSEPFDRQRSHRTTKASIRTESILEVDEIPRRSGKTLVNAAGAAGSSWLSAFGDEDGNKPRPKQASEKRGSSPVIPAVRASAWTETTYDRSEDEGTNWSSVNSPELAVGVPVMQRLGLPSSIRMPGRQDIRGSELSTATLPIMLDTSTVEQADLQSPLLSEAEVVASPILPTWHRRVGDKCPTFSDRKKTRSRKIPSPTPLSLNTISTKKILAIQVEPSPLESPAQAIRQIQAQLRKLDELEQATPESASRRIALLEDLEREMGQQEEHWEEIKHDMGRDSMSSMQTTSPTGRDSRHASVASTINVSRESTRQSIGAERRASRLAQMRSNGNLRAPEAPVRKSGSPQMSKWQKRLTEAQMDYMDAQLLRSSNVNFLQLSRAQLASPTPPDSNDSEIPPLPSFDEEIEVEQPTEEHRKLASLWTSVSKEAAPTSFLWAFVSKPVPEVEVPLPGLSVRPAQRKEWAPLQIESAHLWRKPYNTANRATSGLWRPLWASAAPPAEPLVRVPSKSGFTSQKPSRPVTQRPPRRNKRVTLLPDILESPEPLPDKRGTLGIFQFPWGEKSDTASIQPRASMYMAMPGTMTSGGPSIGMAGRSKQPESTEYSSSFFDDYDDDEEDMVGMDSDEDDSDDGFDDSTLWEIASLLKTDAVPSRSSLLPPPPDSVVDDYIDELTSDEEGQSIVIGLAEPREVLADDQQRDSATLESSTLLMLEDTLESQTPPKPAAARPLGLPANPKAALMNSRAAPAASEATPVPEMSRMPRHTAEVKSAESAHGRGSAGLWYPHPSSQADKPSSARGGLFVSGSGRSDYRGTSEQPAAIYISRTPRPVEQKPLERLMSTSLWVFEDVKNGGRNWILGAEPKHQASTGLWYQPSQVDKPSTRGGLFVSGSSRSDFRGTSEEPASISISRKPRSAEQKRLERLTSTKLWVSEGVTKSCRNWILGAKPKHQASRIQRPQATREDWKAALDEAIAASSPRTKKLNRVTATPAEWQAALQEAISLSSHHHQQQTRPAAFNPAIHHPVFATTSLATRSDCFHPAATGYTYDVSAVHPVFFGSLALTCPEDAVHPAMAAYASRKLRRQRSKTRRASSSSSAEARSRSRSTSRSRSHSRRNEGQQQDMGIGGEGEVYTSSAAPPPIPPVLGETVFCGGDNSAIQAQIEALEQERLFVERAAQEEYRRRTSMSVGVREGPVAVKEEEEEEKEDVRGMETVQELQRRLSLRIRQSLVFTAKAPAGEVSKSKQQPPMTSTSASAGPGKGKQLLWNPHTCRAAPVSPTGLWSAAAEHNSSSAPWTEEDTLAASQRARRRRTMQKKQRRQEILAQMAAVGRGENPFVDFASTKLWATGKGVVVVRDWLHPVPNASASAGPKSKQLWAAAVRTGSDIPSPTALWAAGHSSPDSPPAEEDAFATAQRAESRKTVQKKQLQTTEIPTFTEMGTGLWTSAKTPGRKQQQLWTPPLHPLTSMPSSTSLWTPMTSPAHTNLPPAQEDTYAATERARRRKVMQKLQRRWEILAQIAAVESGANPFIDFKGMGLWRVNNSANTSKGLGGAGRDWLHSLCVRRTRGVVLRY